MYSQHRKTFSLPWDAGCFLCRFPALDHLFFVIYPLLFFFPFTSPICWITVSLFKSRLICVSRLTPRPFFPQPFSPLSSSSCGTQWDGWSGHTDQLKADLFLYHLVSLSVTQLRLEQAKTSASHNFHLWGGLNLPCDPRKTGWYVRKVFLICSFGPIPQRYCNIDHFYAHNLMFHIPKYIINAGIIINPTFTDVWSATY